MENYPPRIIALGYAFISPLGSTHRSRFSNASHTKLALSLRISILCATRNYSFIILVDYASACTVQYVYVSKTAHPTVHNSLNGMVYRTYSFALVLLPPAPSTTQKTLNCTISHIEKCIYVSSFPE